MKARKLISCALALILIFFHTPCVYRITSGKTPLKGSTVVTIDDPRIKREEIAQTGATLLVTVDNGMARVITKSMTVKEMHDTAAALREKGAQVFFAGIEE